MTATGCMHIALGAAPGMPQDVDSYRSTHAAGVALILCYAVSACQLQVALIHTCAVTQCDIACTTYCVYAQDSDIVLWSLMLRSSCKGHPGMRR